MKRFFLFLTVISFVNCGVYVDYDYDTKVDFNSYKTYTYFSDMQTGLSELDERRLIDILDSTLHDMGYRMSESPDFIIDILSHEYRTQGQNVGVGVGGTNGNIGGGISVGIPVTGSRLERSIQFDFVDARREFMFWQAVSESGYRANASPSVRKEVLRKVVDKVFSKYPPE